MKIKKLISFFLILVLSIQVLPMQQIAAWLSSNSVTEEISHTVNPVKSNTGTDEVHPLFTPHTGSSFIHSMMASSLVKHHRAEALIIRHADDILSPPPNC
jgi:hypothetical protein